MTQEKCTLDISELYTTKDNPYVVDEGYARADIKKYSATHNGSYDDTDNYYFHGTDLTNFVHICNAGLKTKANGKVWDISEDKIYVSNTPLGAIGWVLPNIWFRDDYEGQEYPLLVLRVPKKICEWEWDEKGSEQSDFPQTAYSCDQDILPKHIEVLTRKGWRKLI